MPMRVRTIRSALRLAVCALVWVAAARAEVVNKILATVDGEPVTAYQLKRFTQDSIRGRQLGASLDSKSLLDTYITDRLIQKEVSDKGIVVREEDVDRYIGTVMERNKIDEEKLTAALEAQGMTLQAYRAQIREEIERDQLINREIRGKVNVTPEEVQRYYQEHLSEYSTPEKFELAHIFFRLEENAPSDKVAAVTAKADDVYRRIKKGADFAAMAKEYSEDSSGQSGGELGWFKTGEMLESIEKAAARLKVGEVSEPVRTKVGLHIVKVEAREGAAHQKLDELNDQIKQQLYNAALEDRFEKWLTEDLRKRHHVEMVQ
ncbi:MAG: PpiC-type peptidyl-prolyl cis-trans isomerase [Deltaproteobacteria bacterium]|nr:PpiC-type peptidyl-prolyl cis-trans isomerase [Deltaproteobacteria bacterium]